MNVDHEVNLLVEEIRRLGSKRCRWEVKREVWGPLPRRQMCQPL
ncbi:hypothetical protein LEMLEM_LOCUS19966 [Lemmus lemmus]